MIEENIFVPRILVCGDMREFLSRVGQRLFEIVGQIKFFDEMIEPKVNILRDGKFLLNGELVKQDKLSNILRGGVRLHCL